jgi:hypothetical protein
MELGIRVALLHVPRYPTGYVIPRRIFRDLKRYHFFHNLHLRQELFPLHLGYISVRAPANGESDATETTNH